MLYILQATAKVRLSVPAYVVFYTTCTHASRPVGMSGTELKQHGGETPSSNRLCPQHGETRSTVEKPHHPIGLSTARLRSARLRRGTAHQPPRRLAQPYIRHPPSYSARPAALRNRSSTAADRAAISATRPAISARLLRRRTHYPLSTPFCFSTSFMIRHTLIISTCCSCGASRKSRINRCTSGLS